MACRICWNTGRICVTSQRKSRQKVSCSRSLSLSAVRLVMEFSRLLTKRSVTAAGGLAVRLIWRSLIERMSCSRMLSRFALQKGPSNSTFVNFFLFLHNYTIILDDVKDNTVYHLPNLQFHVFQTAGRGASQPAHPPIPPQKKILDPTLSRIERYLSIHYI